MFLESIVVIVLSSMITFTMPRCIRQSLIPDLQQMLYQLSCKYSSAGWAKSQDKATQQHHVCMLCVHIQLTWVQYPKYRFWRKNTVSTNNPDCDGVDLNRNFDAHWSLVYKAIACPIFYCGTDILTSVMLSLQEGSSDDPCSGVYHGESAGSELEVQAITQYILSNAPVLASIDFHSYYQEILFPPGKHCRLVTMELSSTYI